MEKNGAKNNDILHEKKNDIIADNYLTIAACHCCWKNSVGEIFENIS